MTSRDLGIFVISLDFEMMWGCHEWSTTSEYGKTNVKQVRKVISGLLNLFEKYEIHATFATVGLLMCKDKKEALNSFPEKLPSYINANESPFKEGFIAGLKEEEFPLFFAPDIIKQLQGQRGIEIGTHTFSHYYCWSEGQTLEQFESDIIQATKKAKTANIKINSIVFPKNNVASTYLKIAEAYGIKCYRGNPNCFYDQSEKLLVDLKYRIARFLDAYLPLVNNTYFIQNTISNEGISNVPSSRFFRPYSKRLRLLEPLRIGRIKQELRHAAQNGKMYHLWWHPHNFGDNIEQNLDNLEKVLIEYQACKKLYGMRSMNMTEAAKYEFRS
jgi:peptidoglycan/xylan/chitin deacetylase (PgdA/CDA1 family)